MANNNYYMKHFFLYGDACINAGPQNVNRSLVENSDECMLYVESHNKYIRRIEKLLKGLYCSTVVLSADYKLFDIKLFRLFGKRLVYIMHGCVQYENVINNLGLSKQRLLNEKKVLDESDIIVAVSENYSKWVKYKYPQYADKLTFVNNGLEIYNVFYSHEVVAYKNKFSIAVSGGNRPIKCNLEVCRAVDILIKEGMEIQIKAFGRFHDNGEQILNYHFVTQMGHMDKETYYSELRKTDLYVVASDTEPFGLVVGYAINCGCSLLMSKNVGAMSIFDNVLPEDVLYDNHDITEMASKIQHLLLHSNSKRLFDAVDKQKCSARQSYLDLKKICLDE